MTPLVGAGCPAWPVTVPVMVMVEFGEMEPGPRLCNRGGGKACG